MSNIKYLIIISTILQYFIPMPLFAKNGNYPVCKEYNFYNNKDSLESKTFLEKIIEKEPDNVECLLKLADVYINENKISKGFDLLRRAYELNPSYVERSKLSNILDMALKLSRLKERASKENSFILWNKLGDAYYDLAIFPEAAAAYKRSLKIDSNQTKIHIYLSICQYNMSLIYSAIDHLKLALKIDPDDFYANYYLATVLKNDINDYKRAEQYFKKAWEILQKLGVKGFESEEEYNYYKKALTLELNGK